MLASSKSPPPEGSDGDCSRVLASTATTYPRRISRISKARPVFLWISLCSSIFLAISHGQGQDAGSTTISATSATPSSYTSPGISASSALPNATTSLPASSQLPDMPAANSTGPGGRYVYDPPYHAPGLTDQEFNETWWGLPNTLKIGVLLPFTQGNGQPYLHNLSRISLSVLRMAVQDMNDRKTIPGMNISLVVRDSQQHLPGTNISGTTAAVSATTRLLALDVGSVIGDLTVDLTTAEAIMTSSIGVPQCFFPSFTMDTSALNNFAYLFRTTPGLQMYLKGLIEVITHYGWRRISILHTSDVEGLANEKAFSTWCNEKNLEITTVPIPVPEYGGNIEDVAIGPIRTIKNSNDRIHVLIAPRSLQTAILDLARNNGLFDVGHVWMTSGDLSESIAQLQNPPDFNGLIMSDAFWDMSGLPAFESFLTNWNKLNKTEFPESGGTQLTRHETFSYTCLQVIAESYRALVLDAMKITDVSQRNQILGDIMRGNRSQELTLKYIGSSMYNTPIGNFSITKDGDPLFIRISIMSLQSSVSVLNGLYINERLDIFKPIVFRNGDTSVPPDSPSGEEIRPEIGSRFGIVMTTLSSVLMLIIVITAGIVIYNRENIIIKSASPLFCTLELCGIALTLTLVYFNVNVPSEAICKLGAIIPIIGFTINLSAVVVKNYRIYRIFNSVTVINHAVSNKYLLRVIAIPVVLTMIPCIIHICVYNLEPILIRTNKNEYWLVCRSNDPHILWGFLIGFTPGVMLLFAIYLAFKTRNVRRLWNEARSIAFTIYSVTLIIVIVIIVISFPYSLYEVTYTVTLISVLVGTLLEYVVLFYPKLRNLWLQKRGMNVAAGREGALMDTTMGEAGVLNGGRSDLGGASGVFMKQPDSRYGWGLGRGGGKKGPFTEYDNPLGSAGNMQGNPDISDLVSSYPFGQLSGEGNDSLITSPVHHPTIYGSSHTLTNRGRRRGSINNSGEGDQHEMDDLDLSDVHRFPQRPGNLMAPQSNNLNGAVGGGTGLTSCDTSRMASESMAIEAGGYDTFGRTNTLRNSRDAQPADLHGILMASSNRPTNGSINGRNGGMLTVDGNLGSGYHPHPLTTSINMADHTRDDLFGAISEVCPDSQTGSAQGRKLFPLQSAGVQSGGRHYSLQSGMFSMQETRMDSYSVTVPVQRHRWYIMRFLAQWRMSRVIFVPHSKLLVIVDLETERSESLILHSIERGYSHDYGPLDTPGKKTKARNSLETAPVPGVMPEHEVIVLNRASPRPQSSPLLPTNVLQHRQRQESAEDSTNADDFVLPKSMDDITSFHSHHSMVDTQSSPRPTGHSDNSEAEKATPKGWFSLPKSNLGRLNSLKHLSLNLGLNARNMDGEEREGVEGIAYDYVVRVISIHNQVWRVQLPDQETMERWINIGSQIRGENWITIPAMTQRGAQGNQGIAGAGNSPGYRRSSLDRGQPSHRRTGRSGVRNADDEFEELPYRARETAPPGTFQSLYHMDNSYPAPPTTSDHSTTTTSSKASPLVKRRVHREPSISSVNTERQRNRARAHRINQQLKASRYAPLREMMYGGGGMGSRTPRKDHHGSSKGTSSSKTQSGSSNRSRAQRSGLYTSSPTSGSTSGAESARLDASETMPPSTSSSRVASPPLSNEDASTSIRHPLLYAGGAALEEPGRMNEQTSMKDVLAELNVAYDKGQHAIYHDNSPDQEHRRHRFFNNLQHNRNKKQGGRIALDVIDTGYGGGGSDGGDKAQPKSPEWHLTSSEMEKMEDEARAGQRNQLTGSENEDVPTHSTAAARTVSAGRDQYSRAAGGAAATTTELDQAVPIGRSEVPKFWITEYPIDIPAMEPTSTKTPTPLEVSSPAKNERSYDTSPRSEPLPR